MAYISFNDGSAKTLNNGMTTAGITPGSRFASWTPFTRRVGQAATGLGTGARYMFTFRIDYGASFEIRDIPNTSLSTALALIRHLQGGGVCTVATEDGVNSPYTNCGLDPEGEVTLTFQDPITLTYTLSLSVINLSGADMLCQY
jgi:hypothetical protein